MVFYLKVFVSHVVFGTAYGCCQSTVVILLLKYQTLLFFTLFVSIYINIKSSKMHMAIILVVYICRAATINH